MVKYTVNSGVVWYQSTIDIELYGAKNLVKIKYAAASTSYPYMVQECSHSKTLWEHRNIVDHFFSIEQAIILRNALNYIIEESKR